MKNYYRELRHNPPTLEVVKNPKRVTLKMVSCMCDNRSEIKFIKTEDFTGGGFKATAEDLCWMALEGDWDGILKTINSCRNRKSKKFITIKTIRNYEKSISIINRVSVVQFLCINYKVFNQIHQPK
jgi:hypothetical protein